MKQLGERGVYNLPGSNRSVYPVSISQDNYFLYDYEYGASVAPSFRVSSNGRIINWPEGVPVSTIDDLRDTAGGSCL